MLRCLFQPPEESHTRGGVGVRWGEGWGCLPWPPRASLRLLSFSPPSLPFSHSSSLPCPPAGTLSAHEPGPEQPLLLGFPASGGRALPSCAPRGRFGPGGAKGPSPPGWGDTQAGGPWLRAGHRTGGSAQTVPGFSPSQHRHRAPGEAPAPGGPRCWWRGWVPTRVG